MTGAEEVYIQTLAEKAIAVEKLTQLQLAYNATLETGTEATVAESAATVEQAAATDVATTATEGTTVASNGLKVALWAIGIGLITTAIAYLISNWDKLKDSITNIFPALKGTGQAFNEFKEICFGVGSAIIHYIKAPIDFALYGVKAFIDFVKGNFKQAANDISDGAKQIANDLNLLANYAQGAADKAAEYAEEARKIRVQTEIDANERIIKERKALGENTTALEVKNQQLKNSLLDKDDKDYQKKLLDGQSEITVLQNQEIKKRNDAAEKLRKEAAEKAEKLRKEAAEKAAQLKKAELDKLKSGNDEASKVINEGLRSQRDIEIADANFKYNKLLEIAKKYHLSTTKLEEAKGLEISKINKKYSDAVFTYLEKADEDTLSEYDKTRLQIKQGAEAASKNATAEEKALIDRNASMLMLQVSNIEKAAIAAQKAEDKLIRAEDTNRASADGKDPIQVKYAKEQAIRDANLVKLKTDYLKQQALAKGNFDVLKSLEVKFNKDKHDLEEENSKAVIELAKTEKDAKLELYDEVGQALSAAGNLLGKQTVAGKAMAVASATISTYVSAQKAYESLIGTPYVGPVIAPIAAGVAVASGLASVKSILSVKVPGGDSSAGGSNPNYQAPTINSTVLNQGQQGTQNVNVLNQPQQQQQKDIKAYVVEQDISDKQARANYLKRQSTI